MAWADTFYVTTSDLNGQGSLLAAVDSANSTPGRDTIDIAAGLRIDLTTDDPAARRGVVRLTESVTIEGRGATVFSNPAWINTSGDLNPIGDGVRCQSDPPTIVASPAMPFLQIGTFGQDNTGIEVTVRDLNAVGVNNFAIGEQNSSLWIEGVRIEKVRAISPCDRAVVEGNFRGLVIRNTTVEDGYSFRSTIYAGDSYYVFAGVIAGSGNLVMENVSLIDNMAAGAIAWNSGEVKIVSSRFVESGGVQILDGKALIVNSAIDLGTNLGDSWNSIVAGPGGEIDLIASTVYVGFHGDPPDLEGQPLHAAGGSIRLVESAVYGGATAATIGAPLEGRAYYASLGGTFVADNFSWVSPVDDQDASVLRELFQNDLLRTEPPGLSQDLAVSYPQSITPIAPGELIDVIDDAGPGGTHELMNPIDGDPILHDVLGNPRVDANGRRNIGAVQLVLAPYLHLDSTADGSATLSWNRPADPPSGAITGYIVYYREVGAVDWWDVSVTNPAVTGFSVSGLTNGTKYEFEVAALGDAGTLPRSNNVRATPYGEIAAPQVSAVPGAYAVALSWTPGEDGGHDITSYGLYYRPDGSTSWIPAGSTSATQATITGLASEQAYEFGVQARATDPEAHSDLGIVSATTLDPFDDLRAKIVALGVEGVLNHGQVRSLLVKLDRAEIAETAGQTHIALNQLNACGNELRAFVRGGILTSEQGEDLLQSLSWLVEALQGRAADHVPKDSEE
ncbi:MAG: fibronectin type III domain-containing protein [Deltaproteobacteria bacterium]|nr:fibronectin type III domain-containing protein [Deltaproteobacteria bacterium]